MIRRFVAACAVAAALSTAFSASEANAEQAFGRVWGRSYSNHDWNRFYHYPFVYYPQNFWGNEYYRSAESLYYRYPPEMRIPVYNKKWQNYYPEQILVPYSHVRSVGRLYHSGSHFNLDVF